MNLEIAKKAEAWKFSPLNTIKNLDWAPNKSLTKDQILEVKIAVGPSEQQIHTVTLQDLIAQGSAELKSKPTQDFFFNDSNTDRAKLDRSLENFTTSKEVFVFTVLKNPASSLWINPALMGVNLEIKLAPHVHAEILLFETDSTETELTSYSKMSFSLEKEAYLELGLSKSSNQNSATLINLSLEEKAHANIYSMASGTAHYKRLELNIFQKGKGSSCSLNGLHSTANSNIYDFHSNVFHLNEEQKTSQNFKAICKDSSKSIFSGRIHLTEKASGAAVDQINNNLLIDKKSSVDSQPELNIYQDNVKATHGATTSSVDEDHIFYFSSRGFKPEQSKRLLLEAFCKSTCDNLKSKGLKDFFINAIAKELAGV